MPIKLHLEWGEHGITSQRADVYVIVDVLSFSSCVDIALGRGAEVLPFVFKDNRAQDYADRHQALLANKREQPGYSLSPASLLTLPAGSKLVLPSPNGATLSLLTGHTPTVCACLRNAKAVANWLQQQDFRQIQLVPAGERWPDNSLRPAIEDWLDAGAVLAELTAPNQHFSPEAEIARQSFLQQVHAKKLSKTLRQSQSGVELITRGFPADVELAAELNVSQIVPFYQDHSYRALQ